MVIRKKKTKTCKRQQDESQRVGDHWGYIAIKRSTKLHLAHATGRRTQRTCDRLMKQVKQRGRPLTQQDKASMISDGNNQYLKSIKKIFPKDRVNYAQLIKVRRSNHLIQKMKQNRLGRLRLRNIETTTVEKYNGTLRDNMSSLVRKTSGFAKVPEYTDCLLDIHQSYHNLIKPHPSLSTPGGKKRTPAMKENITDHPWNWLELLEFKEHLLHRIK